MLGVALFALAPANSAVAHQEDAQVWSSAVITTDLGEGRSLSLEGQVRIVDDASTFGQAMFRPSISFRLNEAQAAVIGYAYIGTDRGSSPTDHEHRLWQQFSHSWQPAENNWRAQLRTRFEQRFVETNDDIGLRLRQMLRVSIPQTETRALFVSTEPFVTFNDTDWGQESGLDQWRNSVGFSFQMSPSTTFEVGYLNQYDFRSGGDRMNHVLNISVASRW